MEKQTSPPDYLSEAELISLMEKHGIGTDASISTHINNICQRNYVTVTQGRRLIPTALGVVLVHGYEKVHDIKWNNCPVNLSLARFLIFWNISKIRYSLDISFRTLIPQTKRIIHNVSSTSYWCFYVDQSVLRIWFTRLLTIVNIFTHYQNRTKTQLIVSLFDVF